MLVLLLPFSYAPVPQSLSSDVVLRQLVLPEAPVLGELAQQPLSPVTIKALKVRLFVCVSVLCCCVRVSVYLPA